MTTNSRLSPSSLTFVTAPSLSSRAALSVKRWPKDGTLGIIVGKHDYAPSATNSQEKNESCPRRKATFLL
ncbi:hypothetical protein VNO78_34997 [Psophocarpus tetragonolobus]|uniref:Uncharacterized protein n=1 Tax=Psophocarpus tetragonolobus TaxID=3891 RepID=A0AAN9RRA0_PSOTE